MLNKIILFSTLIFAFFIRIVFIDSIPPSLNWDEVSHGYNAYSLLETGSDEWGEPYPAIFRAYGDYKLPVYIYLTVPSIFLFGLTPLGVRLPSIIAGTALVFFLYLLVQQLTKSKRISLITAILVAIEPWGLFLSRVALEANVALTLIVSGIYFYLSAINDKKPGRLILATLLLSVSMWTYNTARLFVPMLAVASVLIYQKKFTKHLSVFRVEAVVSGLIFLLFFLTMVVQLLSAEGSARYENVSILNQGAIGTIEHNRNTSTLPELPKRLLFNRYTYFGLNYLGNYNSHFSIDYLYDSGGDNYQFNIQDHGLMYVISFPLGVIGLLFGLLNKKYRKAAVFFTTWTLIAPMASSLTRESPHALRNIVMLPIPIIFAAFGISYIFSKYKNKLKIIALFFTLIYALSFLLYANSYINDYRKDYSWSWQYGYRQAVDYVMNNYDNYDTIIFTKKYGEPHEFLLFYSEWDPAKFKKDPNLIRFYQSNWYWTDRFDKFYFMNDWEIPKEASEDWLLESKEKIDITGNVLLVTSPGNYPKGWKLVESIEFLDGKLAFEIVEK